MPECCCQKRWFFAIILTSSIVMVLMVYIFDVHRPVIAYVQSRKSDQEKKAWQLLKDTHLKPKTELLWKPKSKIKMKRIKSSGSSTSDIYDQGAEFKKSKAEVERLFELEKDHSIHQPNDEAEAIADSENEIDDTHLPIKLHPSTVDSGETSTAIALLKNKMRDISEQFESGDSIDDDGIEDLDDTLQLDVTVKPTRNEKHKFPRREPYSKSVPSSKIYPNLGSFTQRYPKAIIAGVKKGGTRALLFFLSGHPQIRSAGPEMHFFERDENYDKGLDWYLNSMPMAYENDVVIEKTPGYFVSEDAMQRLLEFSNMQKEPVKLVFIFRDPVIRAVSDYAQSLDQRKKNGKKKLKTFSDVIFSKESPGVIDVDSPKVRIGMYAYHLRKWLKYFPRSQMHFVNGDSYTKNPAPELEKLQKFLELPVVVTSKDIVFNATKGFPCIIVKKRNANKTSCLGDMKGRKHPFVEPYILKKLRRFYAPHNRDFYNLTRINFGWPES